MQHIGVKLVKAASLVRKHHSATALPGTGSCVIFGGVCQSPVNQHFVVFSPSNRLATVYTSAQFAPRKRSGHVSLVVKLNSTLINPQKNRLSADREEGLLVIGGWGGREYGTLTKDFWFLNFVTLTWNNLVFKGDLPEAVNLGLFFHWGEYELLLYRGGDGLHHHSDLWTLNLIDGVWTKHKKRINSDGYTRDLWPAERTAPCGCVIPGPLLIMGGGWNSNGILDDWWTYDGVEWKIIRVTGPVGRRTGARLVYLESKHAILLVGGKTNDDLTYPSLLWAELPHYQGEMENNIEELDSLHFVAPSVIEGSLPGLVGHDVCVVGNTVVVCGGTDTVHKELTSGAFMLEFCLTPGFTYLDHELSMTFRRPLGAFDSSTLIKYAGSFDLSDVLVISKLNVLRNHSCAVDDIEIPSHKVVLAAKSEYFERYFNYCETGELPKLFAPTYSTPYIFELFLMMFYSYHLPTCLMIPGYKTEWKTEDDGLDKQNLAVLLTHCAVKNYPNVINGKRPECLPFALRLVESAITVLQELAQLADHYVCDTLKLHLEIYMACLAVDTAVQRYLLATAERNNMINLKMFLQQNCGVSQLSAPLSKSLLLPATQVSTPRPFNPAESTGLDGLSSEGRSPILVDRIQSDLSPLALPQLRERNYGSMRDLGRQPRRANSAGGGARLPNR